MFIPFPVFILLVTFVIIVDYFSSLISSASSSSLHPLLLLMFRLQLLLFIRLLHDLLCVHLFLLALSSFSSVSLSTASLWAS